MIGVMLKKKFDTIGAAIYAGQHRYNTKMNRHHKMRIAVRCVEGQWEVDPVPSFMYFEEGHMGWRIVSHNDGEEWHQDTEYIKRLEG